MLCGSRPPSALRTATWLHSVYLGGTVLDDRTDAPVAGARILFFPIDSVKRQVIETESDSLGLFGVELPSTGTYRIQVTSLGYTTLHSGDIHVPARPPDFELRLVPEALAIEPITVTAEGRSDRLARIGFYQRQATGHGRFVTADEIGGRAAARITDVLRTVPSARMLTDFEGDGAIGTEVYFRNAVRGLDEKSGGRPCLPTLVLDGVLVRHGGPLPDAQKQRMGGATSRRPIRLDELVHPNNIAGIVI